MKSIWSISVFLSIVIFTIGFTFTNIDPVFADPVDLWCLLGPSICDSDWENRFEITVDNAQVSGSSDLSNFPMLVHISGADFTDNLDDAADTLEDIRFTNQAGTVLLDYEIEKFSQADDELVAWVEVPTLDYNDDTIIYMYYDNAGSPPDQQNAAGVWSSNYVAVYHMENASPPDSTSNNHDGTGTGNSVTTGKIGSANDFDGSGNVRVSNHADFNNLDALTVELWINADNTNDVPISRWGNVGPGMESGFGMFAQPDGSLSNWYMGNGATWSGILDEQRQTDSAWHYYSVVKGSGNSPMESFRNANSIATSGSFTLNANTANEMEIGGDNRGDGPADDRNITALIDEVRISDIARSDDWLSTTYNNINNPVDVVVEGVGTSSTSNAFMALAVEANAGMPIGGTVGSMDSVSLLIAGSQATIEYWWDSLTSLWNDKS
jgi:hypothetical protein